MAEPTPFPQANLELVRPASMTEEECASLPVYRSADPQAFISCWRPTVEDLERLVQGAVTTENPFGEAQHG